MRSTEYKIIIYFKPSWLPILTGRVTESIYRQSTCPVFTMSWFHSLIYKIRAYLEHKKKLKAAKKRTYLFSSCCHSVCIFPSVNAECRPPWRRQEMVDSSRFKGAILTWSLTYLAGRLYVCETHSGQRTFSRKKPTLTADYSFSVLLCRSILVTAVCPIQSETSSYYSRCKCPVNVTFQGTFERRE